MAENLAKARLIAIRRGRGAGVGGRTADGGVLRLDYKHWSHREAEVW